MGEPYSRDNAIENHKMPLDFSRFMISKVVSDYQSISPPITTPRSGANKRNRAMVQEVQKVHPSTLEGSHSFIQDLAWIALALGRTRT